MIIKSINDNLDILNITYVYLESDKNAHKKQLQRKFVPPVAEKRVFKKLPDNYQRHSVHNNMSLKMNFL